MTTPDTALQLYLAGASPARIADNVGVTEQQVGQLIAAELEHRRPGLPPHVAAEIERVNNLWRQAYTQGIAGDLQATALALRLSQHRLELEAHATAQRTEPATPAASIREAWSTLATGAQQAADTLLAIATSGRNEAVRVRAATELLARVGINQRIEVAASVRLHAAAVEEQEPGEHLATAADVIRGRLTALAERQRQMMVIDAEPDLDEGT